MVADPEYEDVELFERIFEQPKIPDLVALDSDTFEKFVGYVFAAAGYAVKIVAKQHYPAGPGVDINLCAPGTDKPIFRVEVKRYAPGNPVQFKEIKEFYGALGLGQGKLPGYFITTSDFSEPAKSAAQEYNGKVRLLNGHQLIRYITYLRGSRVHDVQGLRHTAAPTPPDWLWNENGPYQPYHNAPSRTLVMAVANHKGGVAKTTTALNLGAALAQQGHDVLLIDLDSQANLSSVLPLPDPSPKPRKNAPLPPRTRFVSEWFSGQVSTLQDIVQPTRFSHLWLVPATRELHRLDRGGAAEPEFELSFVRAVHNLSLVGASPSAVSDYRYIILDTPPAQSMYSRLALAASHIVLLPINVEVFAGFGVGGITETTATMRALVGGDVRIVGAVRTRYKPTATVKKEEPALRQQLEQRGIRLFETVIPIDDKIEQAHVITLNGGAKGLFGFPTSTAAEAYKKLLAELLQEV
jgi:chromosome partitioning protein